MTELEKLTRQLITRINDPLIWMKSELENDYHPDELYDIGLYRDTIQSQGIIKQIKEELGKLTEKEGSSSKFKQKKLF